MAITFKENSNMKFTLKQIKQIITEEVANVTKEAYRDRDPSSLTGYANKGRYRSREDVEDDWHRKGDMPFKSSPAKAKMPQGITVEGQAILDFLKKVFGDDTRLADFDKEHALAIRAAMSPEDENHEHLKTLIDYVQARQKEGMKPYDEGDLKVRLTTLMKYGKGI